jgi:hypothetical protein
MSTAVSLFLKKMIFTRIIVLVILICAPQLVPADTIEIEARPPMKAGKVSFDIYDLKTGATPGRLDVDIPEGSSCTIKAVLIWAKVKVAIDAIPALKKVLVVGPSPDKNHPTSFKINDPTGGIVVNQVPPDNTVEGGGLKVTGATHPGEPGARSGGLKGNDSNWLFTFMIWSPPDGNVVVPDGAVMTMTAQKPGKLTLPVSVTGDGVLTAAQLLQLGMNQFEALGVSFTPITDPITGLPGFTSQPFTGSQSQGGGRVRWNAAWSTYLGGAGVGSAPAP